MGQKELCFTLLCVVLIVTLVAMYTMYTSQLRNTSSLLPCPVILNRACVHSRSENESSQAHSASSSVLFKEVPDFVSIMTASNGQYWLVVSFVVCPVH